MQFRGLDELVAVTCPGFVRAFLALTQKTGAYVVAFQARWEDTQGFVVGYFKEKRPSHVFLLVESSFPGLKSRLVIVFLQG